MGLSEDQPAKVFRVEVCEQVDEGARVWKPVLKQATSAFSALGALQSVVATEVSKEQLRFLRETEPDDDPWSADCDHGPNCPECRPHSPAGGEWRKHPVHPDNAKRSSPKDDILRPNTSI